MKLSSRVAGDIIIIVLEGQLDSETSDAFNEDIQTYLKGNEKIVLNFNAVDYISSAGIQSLYLIYRELQPKNGQLVICEPQADVNKIFNLVALSQDIPLFITEQEAIQHLS